MGRRRIGPACPRCRSANSLLCYAVRSGAGDRRIRYFLCEACGARLAREYGVREKWFSPLAEGNARPPLAEQKTPWAASSA